MNKKLTIIFSIVNFVAVGYSTFYNKKKVIYIIILQMGREQRLVPRLHWVQQQQKMLKHLVSIQGMKSWKQIALKMNYIFPNRMKTAKQYRQRYTNYIKYDDQKVERASWTAEEDEIIFQKYAEVGSKWVEISKFIQGRSENQIKNRFYSTLRRLLRRVNSALSQNKSLHKIRKTIKQSSIFKLLQTDIKLDLLSDKINEPEESKQSFVLKLKFDCLKIASKLRGDFDMQQTLNLGYSLHKFNAVTRFENLRKSRKSQTSKRKSFPPILKPSNQYKLGQLSTSLGKINNQSSSVGKGSRQQNEIESLMRNDYLNQVKKMGFEVLNEQVCQQIGNEMEKDLEYELSQILGIKYQPQQFYFL